MGEIRLNGPEQRLAVIQEHIAVNKRLRLELEEKIDKLSRSLREGSADFIARRKQLRARRDAVRREGDLLETEAAVLEIAIYQESLALGTLYKRRRIG